LHSLEDNKTGWTWSDAGDGAAIVTVGGRTFLTDYSRRIVELIVDRKGVLRMPRYLSYREERSGKLESLFRGLEKEGRSVAVLEPGCSSGHLSEAILRYPCVRRLVSFDPDEGMIAVCREKKSHFHFDNWEVRHAASPEFSGEKFDVVLLSAMMEHVAPPLRRTLVESCYERLAPGGLFVALESQNRWWPFEYHVIRLPVPWAHYLPPKWIHLLCRATGRYPKSWSFEEFANPNTGWWGTTVRELAPARGKVCEVSERYGYGREFFYDKWRKTGPTGSVKIIAHKIISFVFSVLGIPSSGLLPSLYIVFRKED
jgi:SAM-dependent methyltransferase